MKLLVLVISLAWMSCASKNHGLSSVPEEVLLEEISPKIFWRDHFALASTSKSLRAGTFGKLASGWLKIGLSPRSLAENVSMCLSSPQFRKNFAGLVLKLCDKEQKLLAGDGSANHEKLLSLVRFVRISQLWDELKKTTSWSKIHLWSEIIGECDVEYGSNLENLLEAIIMGTVFRPNQIDMDILESFMPSEYAKALILMFAKENGIQVLFGDDSLHGLSKVFRRLVWKNLVKLSDNYNCR